MVGVLLDCPLCLHGAERFFHRTGFETRHLQSIRLIKSLKR